MSARRRAAEKPAPHSEAGAGARWGQRVLLAGGVVAFWPALAQPYYAPKALCCAGGVAAAFLSLPRARRSPLTAPILALLGVSVASALLGPDPWQSFWGMSGQSYYGILQLCLYALAYWLGASVDDALIEDGLSALAAAAIICGAAAAAQAAGLVPQPFASLAGRALGPTGNPVFFGAVAAGLLAPSLRAWTAADGPSRGWKRAAAPAAALALWLCRARGAWLAGAAGAAAWLAGSGRMKGRGRSAALGLAAAAIAGGLWLGSPAKKTSDVLRVETWRVALTAVRRRPALGFGPDNFTLAFRQLESDAYAAAVHEAGQIQKSAHDDLLQAAATLGLAGLAAYLWLLLACAWAARGAFSGPRAQLAAAAGGGLLAVFVAAKVNPVPLEGCAVAAWLAGALAPRGEPANPERRWALAAASLAVLACFAGLAGSAEARLASLTALSRGGFERALFYSRLSEKLAPGSFPAEEARGQVLATAVKYAPKDQAAALAASALQEGRAVAKRHPGNPSAHELAGTLAMVDAAASGDTSLYAEARAELSRASELDPHHPFPVERRLEIARALGDKDAQAREQARLDELEKLEGPLDAKP